MPNPYQFPLKSRQAMMVYLADHESYWPMNSWNGGFVLSWNVKVYHADYSGNTGSEPVHPAYDDQWDAYLEQNDHLFWHACEDAARYLLDGDYSTCPGDDCGNYRFMLNGRNGGHLCLMSCAIVPQPRRWRMAPFIFEGRAHWQDYLNELPFAELRRLYKAIACMDQDFTGDNVSAEISHHFNYYRSQWEAEHDAALDEDARRLEASRPDMYGAACREARGDLTSLVPGTRGLAMNFEQP